ncbi:MAG: glyoxal reductase [Cyclobacteriaceae bacterium]|nr:MAG: glyoxal reductase [Cyclobacteriaceae bacterium]
MIQSIHDTVTLHNGVDMPWFGLGVFESKDGAEVQQAIQWALEAGYRSFDTASVYGNEKGVGQALKNCGIPRDQIFLTTKVWNTDQGFDSTVSAFEASLERLQQEYIDLYLVHWPVQEKYKDTWRALEYLYNQKRVRSIGVSNFLVHHLKDLLTDCEIKPMVNQVEFHPRLSQPTLLDFCQSEKIQVEAWSPIMRGKVLEIPELLEISKKYEKTPVQVALRWDLQHGVVTIPKSAQQQRIISNSEIFDFELSREDMAAIDQLDRGERVGPDPDNFNF